MTAAGDEEPGWGVGARRLRAQLALRLKFDATQLESAVGDELRDDLRDERPTPRKSDVNPLRGDVRGDVSAQLTLEALGEAEELVASRSAVQNQPKARRRLKRGVGGVRRGRATGETHRHSQSENNTTADLHGPDTQKRQPIPRSRR